MITHVPVNYLANQTERLNLDRRAERAWETTQSLHRPARRSTITWITSALLRFGTMLRRRPAQPSNTGTPNLTAPAS